MITRHLKKRVNEYKRTVTSACYKHIVDNPTHYFEYNNVEILDRAPTKFKLQIKELLHILKENPEFNKQLNSQSNYQINALTIRTYQQIQQQNK